MPKSCQLPQENHSQKWRAGARSECGPRKRSPTDRYHLPNGGFRQNCRSFALLSSLAIRHGKGVRFDSDSRVMRMMPDKFLAAMIGVLPLPGSPRYAGSSKAVINSALEDLEQYLEAGADVIVLENSHDIPYIKPPLDPQ